MANAVLAVEGIKKSFANNRVLDDVTFEARAGRVHALVGENGAGKSTLMNIVGGIHQPDAGSITLEGRNVRFATPTAAIRSGISIVHQELSLAPNLTVAQNIFCHREPVDRLGFIKWPELFQKTRRLFDRIGLALDPKTPAGDLSVAVQQTVEIAKALSLNARVIILDEPTSALSESEVENLYAIIKGLKAKGVAVVFISHKLGEVFRIADEISVLRDGRLVGSVRASESSPEEIIRMMVGRHIVDLFPPKSSGIGEEILSARSLTRAGCFNDICFSLRRGEILGFAGLVGSGRTEVARAIFGADPLDEGRVVLEGSETEIRSPREAIKKGVCYLTEDRKALGLFLAMTLRKNVVSASLDAFASVLGILKRRAVKAKSRHSVKEMQIRPPDDQADMITLSGGNQQKALLAKWLCTNPKVLIVDEPTRGVDVGAKAKIHGHLRALAESGVGVIVISSELPEVLGLCDRVAVFREGKIRVVLDNDGLTQEDVMKHATN